MVCQKKDFTALGDEKEKDRKGGKKLTRVCFSWKKFDVENGEK